MSQTFEDKKFRNDFKAERDRVMKALRECEELDANLTATLTDLRAGMRRDRGAASLSVRITEQQIANRNQRLALIKELSHLKKDVLDREFRLAKEAGDAATASKGNGPTAALLQHFQAVLLGPNAMLAILEPSDVDSMIASNLGTATPPELPTEINEGDMVCDADGKIYVVAADGVQDTGATAAQVELQGDGNGGPPFAVLEDGRRILVIEFSDEPSPSTDS